MTNKTRKSKKAKPAAAIPIPFHQRFDIPFNIDEVKKNFINRVSNRIFDDFLVGELHSYEIFREIANALGKRYKTYLSFDNYVKDDFYKCLRAVEATYNTLADKRYKEMLSSLVSLILEESEVDLGITWQDGKFIPTGARLLDQELVNEPLRWLSNPKYKNVYHPFAKGLSHFLEAEKRPELLSDVITDMYESLEALAKVITGRPRKDLSANAEPFIKEVKASEHYKRILKEYISYANEFRHALEKGRERPKLSITEVESFIYLTGLFIRLAIGKA